MIDIILYMCVINVNDVVIYGLGYIRLLEYRLSYENVMYVSFFSTFISPDYIVIKMLIL